MWLAVYFEKSDWSECSSNNEHNIAIREGRVELNGHKLAYILAGEQQEHDTDAKLRQI